MLRTLKKNKCLDNFAYEKLYPSGSSPAKIFGSPKTHKPFESNSLPNFRPIVSSIGTCNNNPSQYFCELLSPKFFEWFLHKRYIHICGVIKLSKYKWYKFLVYSDVDNLFTNIPLKEKIKTAVDLIKISYSNLKISSDNLTKLFKFATCETDFLFNGTFYDQIDCVATRSPLAPVLANLFMGHNRKHHSTIEEM